MIVLNVHSSTEDKTDDTKKSCHTELERVIDKFLKHHMSLGDFSDKVDIEGIFEPTTGNEKKNSVVFSPQANYTDRATAAYWRS
jgi:hypothetical protein